MDQVYEKVKANSKFFKLLKEINLSGMPTPSGALPGALPGASGGTAPTTTTGNVNTAVNKAMATLKKDEEALKKAQKTQAQQEINNINNQMKGWTAQANSTDPAQKTAAQAAIKDANIRLQQLKTIAQQK